MSTRSFWAWFASVAKAIEVDPESAELIGQLDRRVQETWPSLSWEIGPDASGDSYLALSPGLNKRFASDAREAVTAAPSVAGWRFYSTRPKKQWFGRFQLETPQGAITINTESWRYVLLRHPGGEFEIVLLSDVASQLSPENRWHAAAIALEGILGETVILEHVASFALEFDLEPRLMEKAKPIQDLPNAFT